MSAISVSDAEALLFIRCLPRVCQPVHIRRSSEGGEHIVWVINDALILRLPVDQTDTRPLLREEELLHLVRRDERLAPMVPACIDIGVWQPHGWRYGLYHKARGVSLESSPDVMTTATEDDLVDFLVCLREVPVRDALDMGVPRDDKVNLEELAGEAARALSVLRARNQLMDLENVLALDELGASFKLDAELGQGTPSEEVLTHGDLKGEHVFVDAAGHITGIIDWSDAQVGCPSVELSGLVVAVGAERAARIATRAGYRADVVREGVMRARWQGLVCLEGIVNGSDDSPEWLVRRQLRRTFEGVGGAESKN